MAAVATLHAHALTRSQVDVWLVRNLAGTYAPLHLEERLPLHGCRSWEDVRNRPIVDLDDLDTAHLIRWESLVVPASLARTRARGQGLASSGRGGVESSS